MPSKRRFFHNISVTMGPHCALDVVKKSLVYMPKKHHQKIKTVSNRVPSKKKAPDATLHRGFSFCRQTNYSYICSAKTTVSYE